MNIARVFPCRTKATPEDPLAFTGPPPRQLPPIDKVHVSVTFSYDLPKAEQLAQQWQSLAPTLIGGPGAGTAGDEFTPGLYLKPGYTITSRGCPNRCWFCQVWRRDGQLRELEVKPGWNVLDDNLLACSDAHFERVMEMLSQQVEKPVFTGGLEAARFSAWHLQRLALVKPKRLYFAYDTPEDWEPLVRAADLCWQAWTQRSHRVMCYVLIGHPRDSMEAAEARLRAVMGLGMMPMAMLYRDALGQVDVEWRRFQRLWARPSILGTTMKQV